MHWAGMGACQQAFCCWEHVRFCCSRYAVHISMLHTVLLWDFCICCDWRGLEEGFCQPRGLCCCFCVKDMGYYRLKLGTLR